MPTQLTEIEARMLGSLVEKSLATPDQYPLSVKALTVACNQKTSRDPVMELEEAAVGKSLFPLIQKGLIEQRFDLGSRVPKFRHHVQRLTKDENPKVIATVCVLLLRGAQTPGEIKQRTDRLCDFVATAEVEGLLQELCARPDPFVVRLKRQPGQKEARYQHLFCGPVAGAASASEMEPASPASAAGTGPVPSASASPEAGAAATPAGAGFVSSAAERAAADDRLARLERRLEALEATVKALEERSKTAA